MVPEGASDTPAPSWERAHGITKQAATLSDDRPRATEGVQAWIDWCANYYGCDKLLFQMTWALDYLGANENCVLPNYVDRAVEESQGISSDDARSRLKNNYGCIGVQPSLTLFNRMDGCCPNTVCLWQNVAVRCYQQT